MPASSLAGFCVGTHWMALGHLNTRKVKYLDPPVLYFVILNFFLQKIFANFMLNWWTWHALFSLFLLGLSLKNGLIVVVSETIILLERRVQATFPCPQTLLLNQLFFF